MQHGNQSATSHPTGAIFATGKLIADNLAALQQALDLLERLDDAQFSQPNGVLALTSVGSHLRHCLDFYQCFLAGLAKGRVNYDQRERDERVEQSRLFAATKIKAMIEGLSQLPAPVERRELEVLLESSAEPTDVAEWSHSSMKRELQFLLSHTIHHYSLIAVSLRAQGFEPGTSFGVAPSTLQYWRQTA
jgi:uncharacterized damage-inducible protein DinB